jgi:phosphopantothenoylcysteine decarboxylase / phosphopantothenate---cysteine ligase
MARILLGVSGGVAAYKALELVRLATGAGHAVRVVQTPTSRRFVGGASFAALTGAPVLTSEFERDPARGAFPDQPRPAHEPLSHLALVANADVFLVAPATANTIAKLAIGAADNLLCSCALAADCPLVIAPAMNDRMYEHAAVQANLAILRRRGATIVEPDVGRLASRGEHGIGRLAEPPRLLAACEAAVGQGGSARRPAGADGDDNGSGARSDSWRGLRVLVTAGGTREPIDSVRFVGNSSSGRMGLALARAALLRGAEVTVVAANVALARPPGAAWREVTTAAELQRECERLFDDCDVLLMAAAVADFRPRDPLAGKLKKEDRERIVLELERTADIVSLLSARRHAGQTVVAFAAEHGGGAVALAREKLAAKRLDAIVVNDISRTDIGFDADDNEVTIVTARGDRHVARAAKSQVAETILDVVAALRDGSAAGATRQAQVLK